MNASLAPSTEWRERAAPDEEARWTQYAERFAAVQSARNGRWGSGRTLHRKQLCGALGTLEVLDGLPPFAAQGLFAQPHDYETWVRLSNGGFDRAGDRVPDIRGFALRVFGVRGNAVLGGPAATQDFTLINQESFAFAGATEFMDFALAAADGNGALLKFLVRRYGLLGAPRQLGKMLKAAGRPFSGFATETLYSAAPMANGPYAVRVRLVPAAANGKPDPAARDDWSADFAARLRSGPLHWDLQLQYYADERSTPIEDASVSWPTPYTTVARLMLPQQEIDCDEGRAMAERVEATAIDPWHALVDHRPLGEVQRARKVVYYRSQQARGAV